MNMKTIKVSEARDLALDWLVAKCEDYEICPVMRGMKTGVRNYEHEPWWVFTPSSDPAQAYPIIDREGILCGPSPFPGIGTAGIGCEWDSAKHIQTGPTLLIAAMRCYVASKLGETVEVPEELVCPNT